MQTRFLKYSMLAICTASILSACGGGGGSTPAPGTGGGSDGGGNPPVTLTGRAIDGPLSGATVTFSNCTNVVITDSEGNFDIPANCSGQITIEGGIDTITSVPFNGQLKGTASADGESIVSPLTTLVENLGGDTAAIANLANSLGLTVEELSSDPMNNKAVYEKAVAVQMMLDEVSKNIDALGSTLTPAEISATAAAALSTALKDTTGPATLSGNSLITTVLTNTISNPQIVTSLAAAGVTSQNVANVASNLVTLTAANIASKIDDAENAIQSVPSNNFTPAALTTASSAMSEYKNDPVVSNLVAGLANTIITTTPATAQAAFETLSTAISNSATTADTVNTAVENVSTSSPTIIPADTVAGIKTKVSSFHANYYELLGFNIGGSNDITPYALTDSLTTPLTASSAILNNLKFTVKAHGTYVANTTPQNFKVALSVVTNEGDYINITASKLALTFNTEGTLTAASIPADSVVVAASSNQNLVATSNSRTAPVSALSDGKISLTSSTLNSIFSGFSSQLSGFNLNGRTVTVTGILSPIGSNTNAIIAADKKALSDATPKYAVSSAYTVGTSAGAGFRANFTINP